MINSTTLLRRRGNYLSGRATKKSDGEEGENVYSEEMHASIERALQDGGEAFSPMAEYEQRRNQVKVH